MPTHWFEQAKANLLQALSVNRRDTLLINPLPDPNDDGERLISAFDDPLSYGGFRVCKARSLYRVKRLHNPGGGMEFTLTTHSGMAAVLEVLVQAINNEAGTTHVAASSREDSPLAQRIENLLAQASTSLAADSGFEFFFGDQRVHLRRDPSGVVRVNAQTPI